MSDALGRRHMVIARSTTFSALMPIGILEDSNRRTWARPDYSDSSREYQDSIDAISGDDLARINAFEPNREPRLWSDVHHHVARRWAA